VAIGHERDVTLAEEVADIRGSTPTDCARRLVPDRQDVMVQLSYLEASLDRGIEGMFANIGDSIARVLNGIDRWRERLGQRLQLAEKSLTMADPRHLLRRGYSLVRSSRGLVRQMSDVRSGDALTVQVSDGMIRTLVKGISDRYDRSQNLQLL
jgi:exodeoxyribonuclease VII large subunit